MQAIILPDKCIRFGNTQTPKSMVEVNGVKLIDRVLAQLKQIDLSRVVIIVDSEERELINYLGNDYNGLKIEYITKSIHDKTNNFDSLALAKEKLQEDDTLLIVSNLILDDTLIPIIANHVYPNLAMVAKYETWMDGTMACIDEDDNIINFIPEDDSRFEDAGVYYKTMNVYKFGKEFSRKELVPYLETNSNMTENVENEQTPGFLAVLSKVPIKALPINKETWYEINDVQDLDIASTIFAKDTEKYKEYHKRYGGYWRFPNLLDYCYLVNPFFPPKRMRDELRANFDTLLINYPSGQWVNSQLAGKYFGVKQDYIVLGNGAAELIKTVMEEHTGNKVGIIYPTFDEYPNRLKPEQIIPFIPYREDFRYTADDLIEYYGVNPVSLLLLINPDNPSGNFIPKDDILRLASWCKERGIELVVDESFVDFSYGSAENTIIDNALLEAHPNMMVMKSISKSYGVPGLRLGVFASCNKELIAKIKKEISIWNINSFGEFYMQIFGKYEKEYHIACQKFIEERETFYKELSEISYLHVMPSQANYFLCEITDKYTSTELAELLINNDIIISNCGRKHHMDGKNLIRLAVRGRSDNARLVEVLKTL